MQIKPLMRIYPLLRDTCNKKHISSERMITQTARKLNRVRCQIMYQFRGWSELEKDVAECFSKYTGIPVEDLIKASEERIDNPYCTTREIKRIIPSWIPEHLELYGNTVIPSYLIKDCKGIDGFIQTLQREYGRTVRIKCTKQSIDKDLVPIETSFRKKRSYKVGYIAEDAFVYERKKR